MSSENILLLSLEVSAVALAIGYLLLAVKQDIRCWIAGIISSCIYLFLMFSANLYMESILQIFYIFMGFYGWKQWSQRDKQDAKFEVETWGCLLYTSDAADE